MSLDGLVGVMSRVIPSDWRQPVIDDLVEEARANNRGRVWLALQTLRVGLTMRASLSADVIRMDVRYAVRSLASARWFTAGAVLTFAIGIGVNVAVFAAVDRMLFRPLPYGHPESLAVVRSCNRETATCFGTLPPGLGLRLTSASATIADIAVAGFTSSYISNRDESVDERLPLVSVSPRMLRTLGVSPAIGRDVSDDEIRTKARVAWISDEAWRARFGAEPAVIGRSLWSANSPLSIPATIIGVLPPGFIPPMSNAPNPEWVGLLVDYDLLVVELGDRMASPLVRLKAQTTLAAAQAEVTGFGLAAAAEAPSETPEFVRVDAIETALFSSYQAYLWLVVTAAGLVGIMACANLASLFLARGRSRERLAAIATTLGATPGRIMTGALLESLCVCTIASLLALWAFAASKSVLVLLLPPMFSRYAAEVTDLRVLGFALAATSVSAVMTGAVPAWRLTKVDVLPLLQKGTPSGRVTRARGGRGLLAAEAAFGAFLVLGAVLASRSFVRLASDDVGFMPDGLYMATVDGGGRLPPDRQLARTREILAAVAELPEVAIAAAGDYVPFNAAPMRGFANGVKGGRAQVSAQYFDALGSPVLFGRVITDADIATHAAVAVVNRSGARALWPDFDPAAVVGRMWQAADEPARVVVGVVADTKITYGQAERLPMVFLPMGVEPTRWGPVLLRTRPGHSLRRDAVLAAVRPRIGEVRLTLTDAPGTLDRTLRDPRFRAALLSTLAFAALLLAAIGLYAVVSYEMATRRYEMGVRLALGASPADLKRLVIWDASLPVAGGALVGLIAAWWTSQFVRSFLFGTDGRNVVDYVLVTAVLLATAAAATWLPARRAAATDPAAVLRAP